MFCAEGGMGEQKIFAELGDDNFHLPWLSSPRRKVLKNNNKKCTVYSNEVPLTIRLITLDGSLSSQCPQQALGYHHLCWADSNLRERSIPSKEEIIYFWLCFSFFFLITLCTIRFLEAQAFNTVPKEIFVDDQTWPPLHCCVYRCEHPEVSFAAGNAHF